MATRWIAFLIVVMMTILVFMIVRMNSWGYFHEGDLAPITGTIDRFI
jgi:hypothetical protein